MSISMQMPCIYHIINHNGAYLLVPWCMANERYSYRVYLPYTLAFDLCIHFRSMVAKQQLRGNWGCSYQNKIDNFHGLCMVRVSCTIHVYLLVSRIPGCMPLHAVIYIPCFTHGNELRVQVPYTLVHTLFGCSL